MTAARVDIPSLVTNESVSLRPVSRHDFPLLLGWQNDIASHDLLSLPKGAEDNRTFAQELEGLLRKTLLLLVLDKYRKPLGYVQAYNMNLRDGWCFQLTYLAPASRGRRFGLEASLTFWDFLFRHFDLRKIYLDVDEANSSWLRTAPVREVGLLSEELGYRRHVAGATGYRDTTTYALYRSRWRRVGPLILRIFGLQAMKGATGRATTSYDSDGAANGRPVVGHDRWEEQRVGSQPKIYHALRFLELSAAGAVPELLQLTADDVTFWNPITGETRGKKDLEALLRFRYRMMQQASQRRRAASAIRWFPPEEEGSQVVIKGLATQSRGAVQLRWLFNETERIHRIEATGPEELLAAYFVGDQPRWPDAS